MVPTGDLPPAWTAAFAKEIGAAVRRRLAGESL
jgi:hypothetical protein